MAKGFGKRIYDIMELSDSGNRATRRFQTFILILIALNVIAVILETVEALSSRYAAFFFSFEIISVAVFTLEYLIRLWLCTYNKKYARPIIGRIKFMISPMAVIDLLAVLPFYAIVFYRFDLRTVRALRLIRLARLFKIGRYSNSVKALSNVFRSKKEDLIMVFFVVAILLTIASSLMYFIENKVQPGKFSSIPASMWWGITTLTTVGYGDIYPMTTAGKVIGSFISLLGIGIFALPAGILASGFAQEVYRMKRKGKKICRHCGSPISKPDGTGEN